MDINPDLANKLIAGGSGSAIAAWLAKVTGWNLTMMFIGGLATSWYIGPMTATFFKLTADEARYAVGFVVGFLAILFLRKVVVIIEAIEWKEIALSIQRWIVKLFGG